MTKQSKLDKDDSLTLGRRLVDAAAENIDLKRKVLNLEAQLTVEEGIPIAGSDSAEAQRALQQAHQTIEELAKENSRLVERVRQSDSTRAKIKDTLQHLRAEAQSVSRSRLVVVGGIMTKAPLEHLKRIAELVTLIEDDLSL